MPSALQVAMLIEAGSKLVKGTVSGSKSLWKGLKSLFGKK